MRKRESWQRWTPLILASSKDRLREAEILIQHGADLTLSAKGQKAIDHAAGPEMKALLSKITEETVAQ